MGLELHKTQIPPENHLGRFQRTHPSFTFGHSDLDSGGKQQELVFKEKNKNKQNPPWATKIFSLV